MNYKINKYVDNLFENAPNNKKTFELKEEILANINDNYNDLINCGIDEEIAYNKAIANIGNIDKLIEESCQTIKKEDEYRKKSGLIRALAIMLFITCPVPILLLQDEMGVILLLVQVGVATGILAYNSYIRPRNISVDDDLYEEFIDWKNRTASNRKYKRDIDSIIWSITVIIYILVSFSYGNWGISWVIFLIGAVVQKIVDALIDLKGEKAYEKE